MQPIAANFTLLFQLLALSEKSKARKFSSELQVPLGRFEFQSPVVNSDGCRFDVYENDQCSTYPNGDILPKKILWSRPKRNALRCRKWLWPDGYIPYELRLTNKTIEEKFMKAVEMINSLKCVRFSPRKSDDIGKFLLVEETMPVIGKSCAATAGTTAPQPRVYLSSICTEGKILHELMHVLGFAHEHQRPDRDSYVRINCENIIENVTQDFRKLQEGVTTMFDMPYDFHSIMHYRVDHFSKNGQPTITPLVSDMDISKIGIMENLSESDVKKVKLLYCT